MTTPQALSVLELIRDAGYASLELWGGATLDSAVRYLDEDPWERLDAFHRVLGKPDHFRMLVRGQNLFAYQPFSDDLVIAFIKEAVHSGAGFVRIFDALNDWRNLQIALLAAKAYDATLEAGLSYTVSPIHTTDYYVHLAQKLVEEGADRIAIKDMAGLLRPNAAIDLFDRLHRAIDVPVTFHSHTTTGVATLNAVLAMMAGLDCIDTAITPFAGGTSHPPIEVIVVFAETLGLDHSLDKEKILRAQTKLFEIYETLRPHIAPNNQTHRPVHYNDVDQRQVDLVLEQLQRGTTDAIAGAVRTMRQLLTTLGYPRHDEEIFQAQIPGGMLSNLQSQLRAMGQLDRLDDILTEVPTVRREVGYVPLVTPTSQIVGSQATFNVLVGRYQMVSNEFRMLLRGEFGRTPEPPDPDLVRAVLGPDETPLRYRPASYLHPVLEEAYGRDGLGQNGISDRGFIRTDRDLLLHLMLKQPADEFLKRKYATRV
jgi:pyruvate/oxaloacetate carboxyltransferase